MSRACRILLPLCALGMLAASPGRSAEGLAYTELPAGRYGITITGMLTTTCARAIEQEAAKLPEVSSAQAGFDSNRLVLEVRLNHTLLISVLDKTLRRASRKVDLGTDYRISGIKYLP
jgi:hypothetical protein